MRSLFPILSLVVLAPLCAQEPESATLTRQMLAGASPVYDWIAEGGVRGVYYSGLSDLERYDPAATVGMNSILNKFGFNPNTPERDLQLHAAQARGCHERGLRYFPEINFNGYLERDYSKREYTPLVDATGRAYPETPSPLDREFWNQSIKRRFVQLAELARTEPIAGVVIDFEMYGADVTLYDPVGCIDYSDLAFNGFLQQQVLALEQVPTAERAAWLAEKNLGEKYEAYYRGTLEAICRDIEQATHAANPDFIIGFYTWGHNSPFWESCARGFGTMTMPVLLWPGTTYTMGHSAREVDDQVRLLERIGAHAVFIPGLWLWQFHPDNLAANAYLCGKHAGGYWLYGIYSMWPETATRRKVPHVDADAFWAALSRANREIQAVRKDPRRQNALKVDPDRPVFSEVDPTAVTGPVALRPLSPGAAALSLDEQIAAPLRYVGIYRAWGAQDTTLTFRVHTPRITPHTNGTVVAVLGPDHAVLARDQVGPGATRDVLVQCPTTGTYTVVTQTGGLCSSVASDAPGFVIDATGGLYLMTRVQPLYFYVPPDVESFTVTGVGQGIERFNARVIAPDGTVIAQAENISSPTALEVTVPAGADGQAWLLDLTPPTDGVLEDVVVRFSDNVPAYLAREKERLMAP